MLAERASARDGGAGGANAIGNGDAGVVTTAGAEAGGGEGSGDEATPTSGQVAAVCCAVRQERHPSTRAPMQSDARCPCWKHWKQIAVMLRLREPDCEEPPGKGDNTCAAATTGNEPPPEGAEPTPGEVDAWRPRRIGDARRA